MLELKQMDLAGVLDKTFKLTFTKNTFKVTGLTFGILFVGLLLIGYYFYNIFKGAFTDISEARIMSNIVTIIPVSIIGILFIIAVYIYYFGILTDLFGFTFLEKEWSINESFKRITKKIGYIIVNGIILSIIFFVVYLIMFSFQFFLITSLNARNNLLLIPVSIVINLSAIAGYVLITFCMTAIILEDKDGLNAIVRSFKLVTYNYWRILGSMLLFNILFLFIFYILLIVLSIIAIIIVVIIFAIFHINFNSSNNMILGITIFGVIISIMGILLHFISSASIAFNTCLFFNQKIKNENYGVEVLAETMISEAGTGESNNQIISETTSGDSPSTENEIKNTIDDNIQKEDQSLSIKDNESTIIGDKKENGGSPENESNQ